MDGMSQTEVYLFGAHRLSRLANLYLTNGTGTQRGETVAEWEPILLLQNTKNVYTESLGVIFTYIYISYISTYRYRETLSKCLWWYMYWNHKWMI